MNISYTYLTFEERKQASTDSDIVMLHEWILFYWVAGQPCQLITHHHMFPIFEVFAPQVIRSRSSIFFAILILFGIRVIARYFVLCLCLLRRIQSRSGRSCSTGSAFHPVIMQYGPLWWKYVLVYILLV